MNQERTLCSDGQMRGECPVAELNLDALALSDGNAAQIWEHPAEFVLRGRLGARQASGADNAGQLEVTEAWRGPAPSASATAFYRVRLQVDECAGRSCRVLEGHLLNTDETLEAAADTLQGAATAGDIGAALQTGKGVMVAAPRARSGDSGALLELVAQGDYYLPYGDVPQSGRSLVSRARVVAMSQAAAAATCDRGWACIWELRNGQWVQLSKYWNYGSHNFSRRSGWYWIFNNQFSGPVDLCRRPGGVNCTITIPAREGVGVDLAPFRSIRLRRR